MFNDLQIFDNVKVMLQNNYFSNISTKQGQNALDEKQF